MNNSILTIIVTYNGMKWIDKCIQSVLASTTHSDIFVVDNASTDSTPDYVAVNYPSVHLVRSQKNLGFGQANNIGLQYAIDNKYDYVYLLNQDAWVNKNTFETMMLSQKNNPEYGILSPLQLQANEKHFDSDFGRTILQKENYSDFYEDLFFGKKVEIIPVSGIMAAHWLISKKCLIDVGGFSPAFYHYGEDNNYVDRARQKGFKIGVVLKALAIHDREGRIDSEEKRMMLEFCQKVVDISGFKMSAKEVLWNYSYEMFLKLLVSRKNFICSLKHYKDFILNIRRYKKIKKISLNRTAFLNKPSETHLR